MKPPAFEDHAPASADEAFALLVAIDVNDQRRQAAVEPGAGRNP